MKFYCRCGGKFEGNNLSNLDRFRIGKYRDLQHELVMISPHYFAALYKSKLMEYDLSPDDFEKYLAEKYSFKESDFRF